MNNLINVDFTNKRKIIEDEFTEEDAEIWNYTAFYEEQARLGYDKGYDPNKLGEKWRTKLD